MCIIHWRHKYIAHVVFSQKKTLKCATERICMRKGLEVGNIVGGVDAVCTIYQDFGQL